MKRGNGERLTLRQYARLLDAVGSPVLVFERSSGNILFANAAARKFYTYTLDEMTHLRMQDLQAVSEEGGWEKIWKIISGESDWVLDHRLAGGGTRQVQVTLEEYDAEEGEVYIATIKDISQQYLVEQTIILKKMFLEKIAQAVVITDPAGKIAYWNAFAGKIYGWSAAEALGQKVTELVNYSVFSDLAQAEMSNIGAGQAWSAECLIVRRDRQEIPVFVDITPITDANGAITGFFILSIDISERKQMEAALRNSEENYRLLVENTPGVVYRYSTRTGGVYYSGGVKKIFGYTAEEMLAQPFLWYNSIHVDDRAVVGRAISQLDAGMEYRVAYRVIDREGNLHWLDDQRIGFMTRGDEIIVQGLAVEITELKNAEFALKAAHDELDQRVRERTAELSKTNEMLEKALRAKDGFLAAVSHELRTPLTSFLGSAQTLAANDSGGLSTQDLKLVNNLNRSGKRLNDLISDILRYSKLQSGVTSVNMELLSLDLICKSVILKVSQETKKKNQRIHFSMQPGDIHLHTDWQILDEVLRHLLDNAVKFTPDGRDVGVDVVGHDAQGKVSISVWDRGIGIDKEDYERIFQTFVQLDARLSRAYQGTGLGLAIVKESMDLLGGSIDVQSRPGEGSRFTITLPW